MTKNEIVWIVSFQGWPKMVDKNMFTRLHVWVQKTIKTMSCRRRVCTKNVEGRCIRRRIFAHCLFGIVNGTSSTAIWKIVKLPQVQILHRYWLDWKPSCTKNVPIDPQKYDFPPQPTTSYICSCGRGIDETFQLVLNPLYSPGLLPWIIVIS